MELCLGPKYGMKAVWITDEWMVMTPVCRVQYSTVQYSTVQYSTVQYSTVQYNTVQYSTVHNGDCNVGLVKPTMAVRVRVLLETQT